MRKIFITTLLSLSFFQVHANNSKSTEHKNIFWKCQTEFRAKARGFTVLGMGKYELAGRGVMTCHPVSLTKPPVSNEAREVINVSSKDELKSDEND